MKKLLLDNKELFNKIDKQEREMTRHDEDLKNIFIILKKLLHDPYPIKNKIVYE